MANEDSIPFGVDPNGKIVFVQDVPRSMRGLKCECTCAICREPLVARLGKIRERHFAHKAGSVTIEHNSRSARESVLHKAAKQMLEKKTQFLLPEIAVPVYGLAQEIEDSRVRDSMPDRLVFAKQRRISIDCLQFEKRIANIIPDAIVGKCGNGAILIEFAVTHFADSRKIEAIKKLGMPVVEVDLRHIDMMSLSREALEFEILSNPNNRYWLTLDDTVREWAAREFRRIEALKTSYYQRLDREVAERKRAEEELKRRKTEELAKKQEEKRRQEEKEEKKRAEEWRKEVREEALRKKRRAGQGEGNGPRRERAKNYRLCRGFEGRQNRISRTVFTLVDVRQLWLYRQGR